MSDFEKHILAELSSAAVVSLNQIDIELGAAKDVELGPAEDGE
jgi:hypothetical protein